MADVEFTLAEGDTEPVMRMQLLVPVQPDDPNRAQYPTGLKPLDLTGATITVKLRIDDNSADEIVGAASADTSTTEPGWIIFPWAGYPPGTYNGRVKVLKNGKQSSYLNHRKFTLVVDADP